MHVVEHSTSSSSSSDGKVDDFCGNDGSYVWIQGHVFIFFIQKVHERIQRDG